MSALSVKGVAHEAALGGGGVELAAQAGEAVALSVNRKVNRFEGCAAWRHMWTCHLCE
jgi:hypothetical protein